MPTFTTLPPETPVQFHARRWLLCGASWDAQPDVLREAPWVAWRQRSGLLQCCSAAELPSRVCALLDEYPQAHLTVLAPKAAADERYSLRNCAPDVDGAHRVSIVFEADSVFQLLTRPETECSEWLGRNGQVLLPMPLDPFTPEQLAEWQGLMHDWTQSCLTAVQVEASENVQNDLEGPESMAPQASAKLSQERAKALAQLLHGLGEDDAEPEASEVDGGWHGARSTGWGANDERYQPARLYGASPSHAPNQFRIEELDTVMHINQRHQTTQLHGSDGVALEVSFHPAPQLKRGSQLLRIDLFDKTPARHQGWIPLPLVVFPSDENPVGPWLIDGKEHPGLLQRFDQWMRKDPALDVEVWVRTLSKA
ncbi:hypothetical protein [Azohydromonas lata]|uniref:Uncharacterized protein n=1 Tax=Azohydromonas lata TaxID=45677 RepID=A0ABU5I9W8_9BURK|nr:hypothetical protein [Azohydromonas lata]MDZ5455330.1 hypothetical protein [Azohydromonas lata]